MTNSVSAELDVTAAMLVVLMAEEGAVDSSICFSDSASVIVVVGGWYKALVAEGGGLAI